MDMCRSCGADDNGYIKSSKTIAFHVDRINDASIKRSRGDSSKPTLVPNSDLVPKPEPDAITLKPEGIEPEPGSSPILSLRA
jgi:hypothetical protein